MRTEHESNRSHPKSLLSTTVNVISSITPWCTRGNDISCHKISIIYTLSPETNWMWLLLTWWGGKGGTKCPWAPLLHNRASKEEEKESFWKHHSHWSWEPCHFVPGRDMSAWWEEWQDTDKEEQMIRELVLFSLSIIKCCQSEDKHFALMPAFSLNHSFCEPSLQHDGLVEPPSLAESINLPWIWS